MVVRHFEASYTVFRHLEKTHPQTVLSGWQVSRFHWVQGFICGSAMLLLMLHAQQSVLAASGSWRLAVVGHVRNV